MRPTKRCWQNVLVFLAKLLRFIVCSSFLVKSYIDQLYFSGKLLMKKKNTKKTKQQRTEVLLEAFNDMMMKLGHREKKAWLWKPHRLHGNPHVDRAITSSSRYNRRHKQENIMQRPGWIIKHTVVVLLGPQINLQMSAGNKGIQLYFWGERDHFKASLCHGDMFTVQ